MENIGDVTQHGQSFRGTNMAGAVRSQDLILIASQQLSVMQFHRYGQKI